jgi:hypothetical protein
MTTTQRPMYEVAAFYQCWYLIYARFVSTWMGDVCFSFSDRRQQIEFGSRDTLYSVTNTAYTHTQLYYQDLELTVSISILTYVLR